MEFEKVVPEGLFYMEKVHVLGFLVQPELKFQPFDLHGRNSWS